MGQNASDKVSNYPVTLKDSRCRWYSKVELFEFSSLVPLNISYQKIFIFAQKWVSGVPYLKNRPWKFCIMHLKSKNLEFLLMWNGQIRWKSLLMFYRTVPPHVIFLRASALGAERVNGSYRQNQRDEGGMVSKFMEHFVKFLITLIC